MLVRLKCTPQPEHTAEAIYLHHRKYLKNIAAVHYIGEAATRHTSPTSQSRYEEYRLVAITYTTDNTFDTSLTINYPNHTNTPNMPFTLVAGDKDTLTSSGLDGRANRGMPDLLATRPIYRPDLNLTKDNMSSQCIFLNQGPTPPGGTHTCTRRTKPPVAQRPYAERRPSRDATQASLPVGQRATSPLQNRHHTAAGRRRRPGTDGPQRP